MPDLRKDSVYVQNCVVYIVLSVDLGQQSFPLALDAILSICDDNRDSFVLWVGWLFAESFAYILHAAKLHGSKQEAPLDLGKILGICNLLVCQLLTYPYQSRFN